MTDDATAQKATVREGYDAMADAYDEATHDADTAALRADLHERLPPDARLLDVGCGPGRPVLNNLPDDVDGVGLDVSTAQLGLARERTDAALVAGDMVRLPVVADAFDAVTAFYSTIHVPIEEHATVYREFARVLRPGGHLLTTASDGGWAGANDDWLDAGARMEWSFPDVATTRDLLDDAGFDVADERTVEAEMDEDSWTFLRCRLRNDV